MRYLLDTHAFIWLVLTPERLAEPMRDHLKSTKQRLLVSSVTAMEASTKHHIGKWPEVKPIITPGDWMQTLHLLQADELPVNTEHALLAGGLDWGHKDPFDRLLAAQAMVEDVPLVSADAAFSSLPGLKVVWSEPGP